MAPQKKAEQMVLTLNSAIERSCNQSSRQAHFEAALQCALIAVDEFLLAYERFPLHPQYIYWTEVKEEINKL